MGMVLCSTPIRHANWPNGDIYVFLQARLGPGTPTLPGNSWKARGAAPPPVFGHFVTLECKSLNDCKGFQINSLPPYQKSQPSKGLLLIPDKKVAVSGRTATTRGSNPMAALDPRRLRGRRLLPSRPERPASTARRVNGRPGKGLRANWTGSGQCNGRPKAGEGGPVRAGSLGRPCLQGRFVQGGPSGPGTSHRYGTRGYHQYGTRHRPCTTV